MKYECKKCKFLSSRKCAFDEHIKTKKHQSNICQTNIHNDIKLSTKKNKNGELNNIMSYHTEDINNDSINSTVTIKLLNEFIKAKDDIIKANEDTIRAKDETINILKENTKNNDMVVKESLKIANTSVSALNVIIQNFPNAPHLEVLTDFSFLHKELTSKEEFPELMLDYYTDKRLVPFLINEVASIYIKDEPSKQSAWALDTSRNNYAIKDLSFDQVSYWTSDKNAERITTRIIQPIIDHIFDEIMWYISDNTRFKKIGPKRAIDMQMSIGELLPKIKGGSLAKEILDGLSPKFQFNKTKYLMETKTKRKIKENKNSEQIVKI